jgi:sugar lactone lactonase YvrE
MNEVEHVLEIKNVIGEGPVWHHAEGALYWVDFIENQHILRYYPDSGKQEKFDTTDPVTAVGFRRGGGLIVSTTTGLAFWNSDAKELEYVSRPLSDRPHIRFNDAAVDRRGRFWVGTVNTEDGKKPDGELYRFDMDGSLRSIDGGFTVSNGIGWSPDGLKMYFADTFNYRIHLYDFDPQRGAVSNRRTFVDFTDHKDLPDGLTVDQAGGVWVAFWGGWKVVRFDSDGRVDREIRMPVANPTSCAFGGAELDELYITTAHLGLSADERLQQPLAGDLFRVRPGVKGIEEPAFAG